MYDTKSAWSLKNNWLSLAKSDKLYSLLVKEIIWERPRIKLFGKSYYVPRHTSFIAEKYVSYKYSGYVHRGEGIPW